MAIQMSLDCSRCHRPDVIELKDFAEATALEGHQKKKAEVLKKLQEFVASLPQEDMPDFFAVFGDKTMVHSYLCDPKDDSKRSCAKRVGELLGGMQELGERKPRTKKAKAEGETPPAAPTES